MRNKLNYDSARRQWCESKTHICTCTHTNNDKNMKFCAYSFMSFARLMLLTCCWCCREANFVWNHQHQTRMRRWCEEKAFVNQTNNDGIALTFSMLSFERIRIFLVRMARPILCVRSIIQQHKFSCIHSQKLSTACIKHVGTQTHTLSKCWKRKTNQITSSFSHRGCFSLHCSPPACLDVYSVTILSKTCITEFLTGFRVILHEPYSIVCITTITIVVYVWYEV